ncbi:MAG TPA: EAL domain-containing protein, partial [Candidatus Saccharimonadales bacterium]|nr:EAL domain-containing protein [Candidatus Saccharimonadales bacterium]
HRNQLHLDRTVAEMSNSIRNVITEGQSMELRSKFHANLTVRVLVEPMRNGGAVITFEDITEHLQSQERVQFLALHDALTGLPNRKMFQDYLDDLFGTAEQQGGYAVLCLDLDHFKEVNDTLGHIAGDELLRAVTERLRGCLRSEDLAARLGGDEFAVVLQGLEDTEAQSTEIANRLVTAIAAPYEVQGNTVVIGVSVGIALAEVDVGGHDLLKRADVALYKAKEDRGTYALYAAGMGDALIARRALEADLGLALRRGEFMLHYQPLFNLAESRVTGFEALIRWDSPTRGWVSPAEFIPLAEQTGLILPIGEWVLRSACADAARWPDDLRVAVNLSAVQMKSRNLVSLVSDILADTGLAPTRLEMEITETAMLQDTDMVLNTLNGLHDMGVRIAMDDFGTGFSSLNYLRLFPFDKIKIDRTFIYDLGMHDLDRPTDGRQRMPSGPGNAETIIRAIVGLGNSLGISTTAEGVETAQQFGRVCEDGCTEVQGDFISPPFPVAQVAAFLESVKARTSLTPGLGESLAA